MESVSTLISNTILDQLDKQALQEKSSYYMRWRFLEAIPICTIGLIVDIVFVLAGIVAGCFTLWKLEVVREFTLVSIKGVATGIADLMRAIEGVSMPTSQKAKTAFHFLFDKDDTNSDK